MEGKEDMLVFEKQKKRCRFRNEGKVKFLSDCAAKP